MALNYLLSPEFQIVNTAGKPATGGYLEVFIHGSRERYYCASDFNGTLYPFQVPLDALGGNVVLADDSNAYDVYAYNRYGSLLMSRYNVHPSSGGSMGGVITSTDGSVTVTATEDGYDLSVNDNKASTLKAAADTLYEDGYYSFRFKEGAGDQITIQNGSIILQDGWYHFSATVKLDWTGINVNQTDQLKLYSALTYDIIDFDYSYNHVDTIMLDGDIYIAPSSTQYISFGRTFTLAVLGMHQGLSAELVDLDIHSITGHGFAGGGEKNIHRLLRYYTNASEADAEHPVGDWLHDLDADDPADPSRHPMVTADQLFAWYAAGQIFELYEVDGSNGQLGWSAVYRMVTWQDQSDWWSQYAETPGKACRLEFFRMGMYSTPYRGGLIAYIRYKDEDYMRLYEIMPGQSIWMAEYQEKLPHYASDWHAGDFLRVKQDGSDLEWVPLSGVALSGSYNDLSDVPANLVQDVDYVHTDNNFTDNDKDKLDNIEAGAEVNLIESVSVAGTALKIESKSVDVPEAGGTTGAWVKGVVSGEDKTRWNSWEDISVTIPDHTSDNFLYLTYFENLEPYAASRTTDTPVIGDITYYWHYAGHATVPSTINEYVASSYTGLPAMTVLANSSNDMLVENRQGFDERSTVLDLLQSVETFSFEVILNIGSFEGLWGGLAFGCSAGESNYGMNVNVYEASRGLGIGLPGWYGTETNRCTATDNFYLKSYDSGRDVHALPKDSNKRRGIGIHHLAVVVDRTANEARGYFDGELAIRRPTISEIGNITSYSFSNGLNDTLQYTQFAIREGDCSTNGGLSYPVPTKPYVKF